LLHKKGNHYAQKALSKDKTEKKTVTCLSGKKSFEALKSLGSATTPV
jgi:hypothetical protein